MTFLEPLAYSFSPSSILSLQISAPLKLLPAEVALMVDSSRVVSSKYPITRVFFSYEYIFLCSYMTFHPKDMLVQAPDLFAAIHIAVPLLDMKR
jgi:hypothetical protein